MKFILLLLVVVFNIGTSCENDQVKHLKKLVKQFSTNSKSTEKKLEEWSIGTNPVCISSKLMQITQINESTKIILQFINNVEHLEAICGFTNERLILNSRVHAKVLRDKHAARRLIRKYEQVNGAVDRYIKYTLKEQKCELSGSVDISKVLIQVYHNFEVLLNALL